MDPFSDQATSSSSRTRVVYYHSHEAAATFYGSQHPMKPHRLALTNSLVLSYGLHEKMEVFRPHRASKEEMLEYHAKDYLEFLERITPYNAGAYMDDLRRFNLADDCPAFANLFDYCQLYTGGSLDCARRLNAGLCDVAINWSGGLHHARKSEASGFCYVNDINLAILELLRVHPRVLYIDIDVHHGDGVQDAFYYTDRVMTFSLHRYGQGFFPGTGNCMEVGKNDGFLFSVNVPLKDGVSDDNYHQLYKPILAEIIRRFDPSVIVLQCGADSLQCDRLGRFNLSIPGHAEAVSYTKSFGRPLMVLGGGGYTIKNVARCWAYETGVAILGVDMSKDLPLNEYFPFFGPDFQLVPPQQMTIIENQNSKAFRDKVLHHTLENLKRLRGSPSVQMSEIPPPLYMHYDKFDDEDVLREADELTLKQRYKDVHITHAGELFDDDKDHEKGELHHDDIVVSTKLVPNSHKSAAQRETQRIVESLAVCR